MKILKGYLGGSEIFGKIKVADTYFRRLVGLLRTDSLSSDEGLLIIPCNQIHTFGMKYAIDIVYMNKAGKVIKVDANIVPGKALKSVKNAHSVLEIAGGTADLKGISPDLAIVFD